MFYHAPNSLFQPPQQFVTAIPRSFSQPSCKFYKYRKRVFHQIQACSTTTPEVFHNRPNKKGFTTTPKS
eukprot:3277629-Pyramimonas_sp.AAC.1